MKTRSTTTNEASAGAEAAFQDLFHNLLNGAAHCRVVYENGEAVDFVYLAVNDAFVRQSGLTDVVGRPVSDVIPGFTESDAHLIQRFERVAASGTADRFDCYVQSLEMWFSIAAYSPAKGEFIAVFDEITERKLADAVLRDNDARYRAMVTSLSEAILVFGSDGRIEVCNPAAERLLDLTAGQLLRKSQAGPGWQSFTEDMVEMSVADTPVSRALATGEAQRNVVVGLRHPDGTFQWLNVNAEPYRSAGPAASLSVIASLTDITERKSIETALRESEERFRRLFEVEKDALFLVECDSGRFLDANAAAQALYGYSRVEFLNMRAEQVSAEPEQTRAGFESRVPKVSLRWHRRKDGSVFPVEIAGSYLTVKGRDIQVAAIRDITERARMEKELRVAAIAFECENGIVVTDPNGVIIRVNGAFSRISGYSAEEAIGQRPSILQSGRQSKDFYDVMWKSLRESGSWQGEIWNRRKDGETYLEWLTISAVTSADGTLLHYVGNFSDITQHKDAQAKIHRLAYYDALTDLPNRRLLSERIQHTLKGHARSGQFSALMFLDLDHFKNLNDTRGHDVGDLLLVEAAQRILKGVRASDTVARVGGDEFVVVLEGIGSDKQQAGVFAALVCEKIRTELEGLYTLGSHVFHCSASIGVVLFSGASESIDTLLKHADLAMYKAKTAGRNMVRFFDPAMQIALDERSALETDLRGALARKELYLVYQAQFDRARHVLGAEALLRWEHPTRGLVPPDVFIPLAEETGLILAIGEFVLETAARQISAWSASPYAKDLRLAVNVSARQFRQPEFAAHVGRILAKSGADPTRLKMELTESVVLDDVADTMEKMFFLKSIGVGFALDDFGTGFSSLAYLTRLPLEQLKIDKSFVCNLPASESDAAIAQAVITMGNSLGMAVIAEGVETEAQLEFLSQRGCNAFQGYLFSRPLGLRDFEQLLSSHP